MKLKAGALQLVIVISILIFVMLGGVMLLQYHNQRYVIRNRQAAVLDRNLQAGVQLLLSQNFTENDRPLLLDLYDRQADSVEISKHLWGVYELGISRSFRLADMRAQPFLIGRELPPKDQYALYLANEDRPLSVSGNTRILGDAYLPPAGIRKAYIEGKQYEGEENPVTGTTHVSDAGLPAPDGALIAQLNRLLKADSLTAQYNEIPLPGDSLVRSFLDTPAFVHAAQPLLLTGAVIKGHVVLQSDSLITIPPDAVLEDILIVAPAIVVEPGFSGRVQLFARDSLIIGRHCRLDYPSALGLLGEVSQEPVMDLQPLMRIDSGSVVQGVVFSHAVSDTFLPEIRVAATATIIGQLHAGGWLELQGAVAGSTRCKRFKLQTPSTLYENFVLDAFMDFTALSPYYRGSPLLAAQEAKRAVVKWLN